jgi:hypothetical protein
MSVVVVNRIKLRVLVEQIADDVQRDLGPVLKGLAGFERYYFVRTDEREATAIIVWDSTEHAQAGAAVVGPSTFNRIIAPHAESQDRAVGPAVASDAT